MKLRKESQQRDAALFTQDYYKRDKLEKQFITSKKVCAHNTLFMIFYWKIACLIFGRESANDLNDF